MKIYIDVANKANALPYLAQRLGQNQEEFKNMISSEVALKKPLPLLTEKEYNQEYETLSASLVSELRNRQACGLKYINDQYPLLPNEKLLADSFSYLKQSLGSCGAASPVLIRHTNLATLYYIFDFHQWSGKEVNLELPQLRDYKSSFKSPVTRGEVVEKLFISLLKGIVGKAGSSIFELVFPENHFSVDYEHIAGIIKSSLNQNTVDEQNGKLNGVVNYMKYTYDTAIKQSKSPSDLINLLRTPESFMNNVIGTLATDPFRKPGLSVYIQAVAMFLGVLQEMAIQEKGKENYKASQFYLNGMLKVKNDAINHINTTFNDITTDRKNFFYPSDGIACRGGDSGYGPEFYKYYEWKDDYTGNSQYFAKEKGYDAEGARNNDMLRSQDAAVSTERDTLKIDNALDQLSKI